MLWVLAMAAGLGAVLLVLPWRFGIQVDASWHNLEASFFIWGLRVLHLELPVRARLSRPDRVRQPRRGKERGWAGRWAEKLVEKLLRRRREGWRRLGKLVPAVRYLFRHILVRELRWHTQVGWADAAVAALVAGAVEAVQTWLALVASHARPSQPLRVTVSCSDRETAFRTELNCIFTLAPAHAIIAGVRAMGALW